MVHKESLKAELTSEQQQLDYHRQLNRLRDEKLITDGKLRAALQTIDRLESRVETLTALDSVPVRLTGRHKKLVRTRHKDISASAGIVLSDWHVEETVEPNTVDGKNEFNLDVAANRIGRTFDKALLLLEDARHLAGIRQVFVCLLGDFITGYIHEELVESNSLAPLPACRWASNQIEIGLRRLVELGDVDEVVVVTAVGNHGRTGIKMRCSTSADNSFEQDMYYKLQQRTQDVPQIHWQIGEGYHNWLEVQGHPIRCHHGEAIRFMGGVGGLHIPTAKKIAQWNKARVARFDIFGHHHTYLPNWLYVCNGSLIGYGAFALKIAADFQPPMQTFMVVDRERGITRILPLFCE